ncbi:MAG: GNAT family N-acetyltransferase [Acidimicrobiia bacterium]|nr:MAG: GNAT family N-acetyltransferase [Acidimicrobiia bacterium]
MTEFTIRPVTAEEYPAFVTAFMEGFSDDVPSDTFAETFRNTLPPERTLAAFEGEDIVGTLGGYDLELTVPGGTVPMEGTTVVTVFPTHRRMGLLRAMMSDHLDNAIANGYPIAGLWASESDIYGRFGYGVATYAYSGTMDGSRVVLRDEISVERVLRIRGEHAIDILPAVFDRVRVGTPGMFARDATWWIYDILRDEDWMKRGRTSKRYVVHDGPDGPDGYAIYRQKSGESDDGHADGTVRVMEVIAGTPVARASLWSFLTQVDGCPNVRVWNMAIDDPLSMMVVEPRRMRMTGTFDALWVRILNVPAALESRTYELDGSVIFAVVDPFRVDTEGTYRLTVDGGSGTCESVDGVPDVELDIDVLGALYLGAGRAHGYAAANRIRGSRADIDALERMFRTSRQPWCNQVF